MKTPLIFLIGILIVLNSTHVFARNDSTKKITHYALIDYGKSKPAKVFIVDVTDSTLLLKRVSSSYEFSLSYSEIEKIKIIRSRKPETCIGIGAGAGLTAGLIVGFVAAPPPEIDPITGSSLSDIARLSTVTGFAFLGLVTGTITGAAICFIPTKKITVHRDKQLFSAAIPVLKKYRVDDAQ